MKYTRESLYVGFRFLSCGDELEITHIGEGDDYEAIVYDLNPRTETLSISFLLGLLNNGERKEIKRRFDYELY